MDLTKEIKRRRTFAIISHPDAGKTTITENLLLHGGAIQMAGTVKAKRSKKYATSDWMALERQRGISVTSSVLKFQYLDCEFNLIDTPGHQDFSEDTYRTLTAVDSVLMLIDSANGVEKQTKKLFQVCKLHKIPIVTFFNKVDRPGRDPFDLIDEIEKILEIELSPINWTIGQGEEFQGLYHCIDKTLTQKDSQTQTIDWEEEDTKLRAIIGNNACDTLAENLTLIEGAGNRFDPEHYLNGQLTPAFFGSALKNFGIEALLQFLRSFAPPPRAKQSHERLVSATEKKFTAFIFKIQANMDPAHRDRVAYMRICSGSFSRGMKAYHVRLKRYIRLARPTQFMAQDRSLVDAAFAGDIVGIHDPSLFKIGDSLSEGEEVNFTGIPVFAPEHFVRIQLQNPLKTKQLKKGLDQLSEEGAVQVFRPLNNNEQYLGVVGVLQIEVVQYRLKAEYNVDVVMHGLNYSAARWLKSHDKNTLSKIQIEQGSNICLDSHANPVLLLDHDWRLKYHQERYPEIQFFETMEATMGIQC